MRLLLDTNIYVFMASDQKSLTKDVCAYLEDPEKLEISLYCKPSGAHYCVSYKESAIKCLEDGGRNDLICSE